MPLKPPFLGAFDVVEFLGAVRTPASLVRTSKMAVLSAQRGKTHFPVTLTLTLSACLEDRPACFPIFTASDEFMAATDSPLFPRDLGKETGVAWLGPLPTSLGTFGAAPGKTSGSTAGWVSTSSRSPSLSLEGQGDFFRGRCLAPHLLPHPGGRSPYLRILPSL